MSWDRCTIGHPGLMVLKSECITVPVAALSFHEHFSDSIVPVSSRYMRPILVSFSEFTKNSYSDGLSFIEDPQP